MFLSRSFPCALAAGIFASIASAAEPASIAPLGADGKPLNLGFESGSLAEVAATGNAWVKQPIKADAVALRHSDMKSEHTGTYWLGGFESGATDGATGTLTSKPFKVTQPWASFLVGGGDWPETRVEIVLKDG